MDTMIPTTISTKPIRRVPKIATYNYHHRVIARFRIVLPKYIAHPPIKRKQPCNTIGDDAAEGREGNGEDK